MIGTVLRLLWRLFVGVIAVGLAYGMIFLFYPYLRHRMSLFITIVILYVVIAYFGIPFVVQLWRLVIRPNHLPHYAVTRDGWSSDPVNIAVVCKSEASLRRAMIKAGWHVADEQNLKNSLREIWAIVFNLPYPTAPFNNLFLLGRPQDIGFQIQDGDPPTPRHRHHVRFWQLEEAPEKPHDHQGFWESILQIFTTKRRQIWIGTATHDVGPFALRIQNLQVTHKIDRETNRERDFLIQTLADARVVKRCETIPAGSPITFRGQTLGVNIVTDGTLRVVELRSR